MILTFIELIQHLSLTHELVFSERPIVIIRDTATALRCPVEFLGARGSVEQCFCKQAQICLYHVHAQVSHLQIQALPRLTVWGSSASRNETNSNEMHATNKCCQF